MKRGGINADGEVITDLPGRMRWSAPRNPTPGSTFRLATNPLGSAGNQSYNGGSGGVVTLDGDRMGGRLKPKPRGIKDAQMVDIPRRHQEPRNSSER